MQRAANTDLSVHLVEKRPIIKVDSNGGLCFPFTGLPGILTFCSVGTIGRQTGLSPNFFPDETLDPVVETLPSHSSVPLPPKPANANRSSDPPLIPYPYKRAFQHLVSGPAQHNDPPLPYQINTHKLKATPIARCFQWCHTQVCIGTVDLVCMT